MTKVGETWRAFLADILDFSQERSWPWKILNIIIILAVDLLWVLVAVTVINRVFGPSTLQDWNFWSAVGLDRMELAQKNIWATFFFACVTAPLFEEIIFRWHPLWQTLKLFPNDRKALFTKICFVSVIFGVMHGGILNIFIQGVGGVFLSYIFLKNGKSYWSAVVTHALYNLIVITVSLVVKSPYILQALS